MPTDHRPTPAAGTGGAARIDLGPAKYDFARKLNAIVSVAKTWEDAALFAPPPATPAPDTLSHRSVAPELPARSGGSTAADTPPGPYTLGPKGRNGQDLFDADGRCIGRLWADTPDYGSRAGSAIVAWSAAPPPERVADGAGLPTVEELAEALYAEGLMPAVLPQPGDAWVHLPETTYGSDYAGRLLARAAAILARLAPSRDRTADGRVDAGAVREAARALVDKAAKWQMLYASPYVVQEPEFETLRDALDRAGDGWRPIETAPKDGTHVWLYRPECPEDERQAVGWWHEDVFADSAWWMDPTDSEQSQPTHWRPLPAPPSAQPREDRT